MTAPFSAASLDGLEDVLVDPGWFRVHPHGIHGVSHVTRVLVWSAVIAHTLADVSALRWDALRWAASVHDVGRIDDGIDRGHGARSAAWVMERLPHVRPSVPARDLPAIADLCYWHEIHDDRIGHWTLELAILKDADGLDRCRLGDLDPERLRLQVSRWLVSDAERLYRLTGYGAEIAASDVLAAARRLASDNA